MQRDFLLLLFNNPIVKLFHHPFSSILRDYPGRNDCVGTLLGTSNKTFFIIFLASAILTWGIDFLLGLLVEKINLPFLKLLYVFIVVIYVSFDNWLNSSLIRILIEGRLERISICSFFLLLKLRLRDNFRFFYQTQLSLLYFKQSCSIYLVKVFNLWPVLLRVINEDVIMKNLLIQRLFIFISDLNLLFFPLNLLIAFFKLLFSCFVSIRWCNSWDKSLLHILKLLLELI